MNFLKRDLHFSKVAVPQLVTKPQPVKLWMLTDLGWAVVRFETERREKERQKVVGQEHQALLVALRRLRSGSTSSR